MSLYVSPGNNRVFYFPVKKKFLVAAAPAVIAVLMTACSAVSFIHANGKRGQNITNAEVWPDNTVVLTYPNGTACIDTNPGESQACKGQ